MKKLMVLGLILGATAMAGDFEQIELGRVVGVKRLFKTDAAKCEKAFQWVRGDRTAGSCVVRHFAETEFDKVVRGSSHTFVYNDPRDQRPVDVKVFANSYGYEIEVSKRGMSNGLGSTADAMYYVRQALERVKQVEAVLYTVVN